MHLLRLFQVFLQIMLFGVAEAAEGDLDEA
jgi:hypothetical protein